ncbi:MAG: hypothetical protein ACREXY_22180 [Gammaproteobacteria bacterium]
MSRIVAIVALLVVGVGLALFVAALRGGGSLDARVWFVLVGAVLAVGWYTGRHLREVSGSRSRLAQLSAIPRPAFAIVGATAVASLVIAALLPMSAESDPSALDVFGPLVAALFCAGDAVILLAASGKAP